MQPLASGNCSFHTLLETMLDTGLLRDIAYLMLPNDIRELLNVRLYDN